MPKSQMDETRRSTLRRVARETTARRPIFALHIGEYHLHTGGRPAQRIHGYFGDGFGERALLLKRAAFEKLDVYCGHGGSGVAVEI